MHRRKSKTKLANLNQSQPQSKYDIAFFWKQNDSGLYGRRSDIVARYLAASGRVNRIVHFDAPMSVHVINQLFCSAPVDVKSQQTLILQNLVDRRMGLMDDERTTHRTFVNSPHERRATLLGEPLYKLEAYARYVREELDKVGMHPSTTWAWFCPIIWEAPMLIKQIGFAGVVSDLIDDQRAWDTVETHARRLHDNYRDTLAASDIVFANCDALANGMSEYASDLQVVPNGAERFLNWPTPSCPPALSEVQGPIAGYVGNLRDRIDWMLMQEVVASLPQITFVFAGPAGDNKNADSLGRFPNVIMPGVVHYSDLPAWLNRFDVGLVPHVNNRLTAKMNPLKVYNYFAAGLPVVSTEVDNLGALGDSITVVNSSHAFSEAIKAAINSPVDTSTIAWQQTMDTIAWDSRVRAMLDVLDSRSAAPKRHAG